MALEIRTSLRPERPGTTPEGDKKQRESRDERERKRNDNPGQNTDRNKGEEKANPNKKERQKHQQKQERGPKSRSTTAPREERRETRKRRWSQNSHTFRTDQWMARGARVGLKDQGATMKQLERRGTDSPDQSAARKARYQLKENNQENTSTGKDRRQGDVKPMKRQ